MNTPRMRVFFALWPDAAVRTSLDAVAGKLHERLGGRRTRPDTLHLTLAFIGEMDSTRLPELMAAAEGVTVPRFEMRFDRCDCWRHNHVAHLAASQSPPDLLKLVVQLETRLSGAGIPFDRRPYVPHVTLLRQADCNAEMTNPAPAPIRWPTRDFVLVRSSLRSGGALYEQLGRWPLL